MFLRILVMAVFVFSGFFDMIIVNYLGSITSKAHCYMSGVAADEL